MELGSYIFNFRGTEDDIIKALELIRNRVIGKHVRFFRALELNLHHDNECIIGKKQNVAVFSVTRVRARSKSHATGTLVYK